jgi:hypothetical protein
MRTRRFVACLVMSVIGATGFATISTAPATATAISNHGGLQFGRSVREMPRRTDPIALSCPKAGYCAGVDVEGNAFVERAGSWAPPKRLPGVVGSTALSCATPTSCLAMGIPHDFRWNGRRWIRIPRTLVAESVSCISPTRCLAVASTSNQGMWWLGNRWSKPFRLTARRDRDPERVVCPDRSTCVVAYTDGSVNTWNGRRWSKAHRVLDDVFDLACAGPRSCLITNAVQSRSWNGRSWGRTKKISTSRNVAVEKLSCIASGECVGVGNGGLMTYRAGRWSGPNPVGTDDDSAQVVDCVSAKDCTAVAFDGTLLTGTATALAPTGDVDRQTAATSMSCASTVACVVVDSTGHARTWDGSAWGRRTRVDGVGLNSVSCPTASHCSAVDLSGRVLTDSDGVWSKPVMVDPQYAAGGQPDQLSCATPGDCVLVSGGFVVNEKAGVWGRPLNLDSGPILPQPFPDPGPLLSVSCSGPDFCVATDFFGRVFLYDGLLWSSGEEIDPSAAKWFGLNHISCSGPTNCVAEATGNQPRHANLTRLWRYDGQTWTRFASPADEADLGGAGGISCPTLGRCVTTNGEIIDHAGRIRRILIPKDGDFPGEFGGVAQISCPTRAFCAAVDGASGVAFGRG